ncbi:anti-sigma factor [Roseovarius sp. SCSIO 43702]|uniref:anti-sigma factor n=1 Tax=Roseovarius sp. SCSIO 43702 TaxID=2823043 RepID=UPI001C7317B7|nr:anti-sigma factor [Roseovarius sp. SCSIO 43702]QYX58159.1 anti-sigma factor [Roseovarius sp. SCSIO 43702]
MSATPERDDDTILAGEYALGLMSPEEARAFEARLAAEPGLRVLYAAWSEDFARLAEEIPPETPPARVQARLEEELFGGRQGRRRMMPGWWPLGGALAAVALALAVVFGTDLSEPEPATPDYIAEIAAEDGSLVIEAGYHAQEARLVLERHAGEARPGRALELWLLDGDAPPASLGVLPEGPQAEFTVAEGHRQALPNARLAISDEPRGGSPTGLPTGDVLAVGRVSSL